MRAEWLSRTGRADLLLVLGGWAVGAEPFRHLETAADVLVLSDYRVLDWRDAVTAGYDRVTLVAYSFGVAAAGAVLPQLTRPPVQLHAFCGSPFPCDARRGIAPGVLRATAEGLSEASLARFARRAGAPVPAPDIAALRDELCAVAARPPAPVPAFDRITLARRDRIFAPAALTLAWADQASRLRWTETGHTPFAGWQSWTEALA